MIGLRSFLVVAATAGALIAAHAQTPPAVSDAWARPTVKGQASGGAYLRIVGGPGADRLLSVRSEVADRVEVHTMSMDGDVMRMRQLPALEVPAGQTVELKPGAQHLMFIGLKRPLAQGSQFPLMLKFEKAGEVRVEVSVRNAAGSTPDHSHHKH